MWPRERIVISSLLDPKCIALTTFGEQLEEGPKEDNTNEDKERRKDLFVQFVLSPTTILTAAIALSSEFWRTIDT